VISKTIITQNQFGAARWKQADVVIQSPPVGAAAIQVRQNLTITTAGTSQASWILNAGVVPTMRAAMSGANRFTKIANGTSYRGRIYQARTDRRHQAG
jgi:hypothetical protein